ncbi:MAG TPA: SH3 domain-containing protein [Abditibacteriaceae bacterium]|jgi:hypothetical protein
MNPEIQKPEPDATPATPVDSGADAAEMEALVAAAYADGPTERPTTCDLASTMPVCVFEGPNLASEVMTVLTPTSNVAVIGRDYPFTKIQFPDGEEGYVCACPSCRNNLTVIPHTNLSFHCEGVHHYEVHYTNWKQQVDHFYVHRFSISNMGNIPFTGTIHLRLFNAAGKVFHSKKYVCEKEDFKVSSMNTNLVEETPCLAQHYEFEVRGVIYTGRMRLLMQPVDNRVEIDGLEPLPESKPTTE